MIATIDEAVQTAMIDLNASADLVKSVLADVLENAPETTDALRQVSANMYISSVLFDRDVAPLADNHRVWLEAVLNDMEVLRKIDSLREQMRGTGNAALAAEDMIRILWRDEE